MDNVAVARELASHLRLKHPHQPILLCQSFSGEGTGFSSEIETQIMQHGMDIRLNVARELASHLRLKLHRGR